MTLPSGTGADPKADPSVRVESGQWAAAPSEASQAALAARWVSLAVAKPYVRSVSWAQSSDAHPHLYPHGGLFRADQSPKPAYQWLQEFRRETLA